MSTLRRSRSSQSGFSLAEVFVATAIFAIIFIAALLVYDRSNKIFKSGVEAADLQQNTRVAFDKLMADARLAGFDFDRDGVPTFAGQSQQPDEQIEYAGPSALTIRGNFNYTGSDNNGRIPALELPNSQFPIVTTGNDEIVTYALVPDNPSAVTESLTFYADVSDGTVEKRQSYPGGSEEDTITITGVDLCDDDKNGDGVAGCEQPPYTLYRFTVNKTGGVDRTPMANNIRSLSFTYYNDVAGTSPLAITDPGGGKYDPATPASINAAARTKRAEVRAVRIALVGMNQSSDAGWVQPGETIASVKNYRQYTLQSMVVPRNLGKRGMKEQQTLAPGAPVLQSVCFNYCGLVKINWTAPPASGGTGEVETYHVLWDTDFDKTMASPPQESRSAGLATTTYITGLDPNTHYRFSVAATNSYGTTYAIAQVDGKPLNATTPSAPTLVSVSGAPSPQANQITLTWTLPTTNVSGIDTSSCVTPAGAVTTATVAPQPSEMQGIEIWRSTNPSFDPAASPQPASTVKVGVVSASSGTFADKTAANCVDYYYRIRVVEYCGTDPNKNVGSIVGQSAFFPAVGNPATKGRAESTVAPSKPGLLDVTNGASTCSGVGTNTVCDVKMTWPQVVSDVSGTTIGVDAYDIQIDNGVDAPTTRRVSLSNGDITVSGGVVSATVTNIKKFNSVTATGYIYHFAARAVQCEIPGAWSDKDQWPECSFANGQVLTIFMSGLNGGTGTAADPFQVLGAETITFSVPSAKIIKAEASVYNVATGALVQTLTPATGTSNSISLGWPDSGDNTNFRVEYVLTDSATPGCTERGYFYVRETTVSCPFEILTSSSFTTVKPNPGSVTFGLKNLTAFDITFVKADITWNEDLAHPSRGVVITSVALPSSAGSGTVNATLTGQFSKPGGVGTFTATSGSAAKVFANDLTGNYKIKLNFDITGNKPLQNMPITKITIFYRLPGDAVADTRQCDIYP